MVLCALTQFRRSGSKFSNKEAVPKKKGKSTGKKKSQVAEN